MGVTVIVPATPAVVDEGKPVTPNESRTATGVILETKPLPAVVW